MADKSNAPARAEAQQVFRQFAWNIAGTLNGAKAQKPAARRPRAGATRKRAVAK